MDADGSISQCHTTANIRRQRGVFEEMLVSIEFFIVIVHQQGLKQAMSFGSVM
jgi:hypothetical protein